MSARVVFVSGIDTGIGKTYATGYLARREREKGLKVATLKLVQTGNEGFSEDIKTHREIMGASLPEDADFTTAPQIFRFPSSPELAARLEGREVDTGKIAASVAKLAGRYDAVFVEGAGGLMVPLKENLLTVDFAAAMGWSVLLVTCARLGSVNHTLLSLEAILARRMALDGVAFNWCEGADPEIAKDTMNVVRRYLSAKGLGEVPFVTIPKL